MQEKLEKYIQKSWNFSIFTGDARKLKPVTSVKWSRMKSKI